MIPVPTGARVWLAAGRTDDVHAANRSEIAKEALNRIAQLYAVETSINGQTPA